MKKPQVLFLTYHFPPKEGIACVRSSNAARHLARLGWGVTVVTPHEALWNKKDDGAPGDAELSTEGINVVRTVYDFKGWEYTALWELPENSLRRFIGTTLRKLIKRLSPTYDLCWTRALRQSFPRLAAREFQVIMATGAPWTTFVCARELSDLTGRPFVLDYRDLWTTDTPYGAARSRREQALEAELFASSAAVTVVSRGMRETLAERFGSRHKIHVVTNGFNAEEFKSVRPLELRQPALVYAGTLVPPKRTLDPVFQALSALKESRLPESSIPTVHYFGPNGALAMDSARKFGADDYLQVWGNRPRREALAALKAAHLAVVVTSVFDEKGAPIQGVITGKVFEALALGRPILLIAPSQSDAATVIGPHGVRCSGSDIDGICAAIRTYVGKWHTDYDPPPEYSWSSIARNLDCALSQALKSSPSIDGRDQKGLVSTHQSAATPKPKECGGPRPQRAAGHG